MTVVAEHPTIPKVPGSLPLVGHTLRMVRNPLKFAGEAAALGPIVRIYLGPKMAYMVSNHELLYEILVRQTKSFEKGRHFERARPLLGNGILLSSGSFHRRQRLIMNPAFTKDNIASYLDVMRSAADDIFDTWEDGQDVKMYHMFYELAVRIVIKSMFTTEMAEQDIAEVYRSMPTVISGFERRAAIPPALLDLFPTKSGKEFYAAVERLRVIGHRIVADYRTRDELPRNDLMALLLNSRAEGDELMTDKQIHDEFMTLLTAGSETAPSAMGWSCYLLGKYPETQERIQAEVDKVFEGGPVTAKGLERLEYTRRVVKESLRLYPPVWAISRCTKEDVTICGYPLAANTQVFYSIHSVQRDPGVYDDPDGFHPERWEGEQGKRLPRSAFVPFGAGIRNCIGENFAWTEIQAVLATLLSKWTITPVDNAPVPPIAMGALVPGPLPMTVTRRKK